MEWVLVPILDTLILVTGLLGHVLVILVLSRTIRGGGRSPSVVGVSDVLLLDLSAADLLLLSCVPYHTVSIATHSWPFGDFLCKAVNFLGAVSSSASAFTLAALAVSRYIVVVHPAQAYRWRRSRRRVWLVAMAPWVPALLLAVPQFAARTLIETRSARANEVCFNFLSEEEQLAYGVCHFVLAFVLPLMVIVVAYGRVFHFLRVTRVARVTHGGGAEHLERYQARVTHTSVLLVLAFVLCWMPSYILMMLRLAYSSAHTQPTPTFGPFATFARVMATSSTVANPILYVFMSQKFREELQDLVRGRSHCCAKNEA